MRNLLHTAIVLLLLSNPLLAGSFTLLEVGHFDPSGGPLLQSPAHRAEALSSTARCELLRTTPTSSAAIVAEFSIGAEGSFSESGYFLSDWIPVEYFKGSKLQLRIYPDANSRASYYESPQILLQEGRQQIGFATDEWSYREAEDAQSSAGVVRETRLHSAYPNPFNAVATVEFDLASATHVKLELYNMLGRRVKVLADGPLPAGSYRQEVDGARLATGVYLLRFATADGISTTRKLTLLK